MKGFVFDPSRLRGSEKQQERASYAVVGQMLREYLGGDPLDDARRPALADPHSRRCRPRWLRRWPIWPSALPETTR